MRRLLPQQLSLMMDEVNSHRLHSSPLPTKRWLATKLQGRSTEGRLARVQGHHSSQKQTRSPPLIPIRTATTEPLSVRVSIPWAAILNRELGTFPRHILENLEASSQTRTSRDFSMPRLEATTQVIRVQLDHSSPLWTTRSLMALTDHRSVTVSNF